MIDVINGLEEGEVFIAEPLFPGLDQTPVSCVVTEKRGAQTMIRATWNGVFIGDFLIEGSKFEELS